MSLRRLLLIFSTATAGVLILIGGVQYVLTTSETKDFSRESFSASVQNIGLTVQQYLHQLVETTDRFAVEPYSVSLTDGEALAAINRSAADYARFHPALLGLRVLPPDIEQPDKSQSPQMGYADLVMVREALNSNPQPAVHGFGTPDVHLAIARKLVVDEKAVGIILASYSINHLRKMINGVNLKNRAIELKQGDLSIAFSGDEGFRNKEPSGVLSVGKIGWKINYWVSQEIGMWLVLFCSTVLIGLLLIILVYNLGFRRFKQALLHDQSTIVNCVQDLVSGQTAGRYPVRVKELEDVIANVTKLRWMVATDADSAKPNEEPDRETSAPPSLLYMKEKVELETESMQSLPATIFRAYDIRGVVGETLTVDIVRAIGQALGSEVAESGEQTVVIARDGRLSSPDLSSALAKGLQQSGCNVIDVGMVPTPVLYFATHFLDSNSGIMVTGSHNPPNYNGLKMVVGGETLSDERIQRLRKRIEDDDFTSGAGSYETKDLIADYIGAITDDVQIGQPMKVVVDCGNGVAGAVAPVLLRSIGCEVAELFCDVDGNFPNHHPDPSKPENLKALVESVGNEGAHLGLAFDGDGDRLGVVDSAGTLIWPDRLLMLFAGDVLSRQPGADIIYDVKCSKHLATQIVKHGGRPIMWKTGHSLIKAKIKETGAQLAGEMSGHIFFRERWFGFDDALYSAARLLEILSADPRPSQEVFGELPDSINTPELTIDLAEGENFAFVDKILSKAKFNDAKITTIDGLRVDFSDGWGLVRASNTTPSLVLRFEADNPQALQRIQADFKTLMKEVNPDLSFPY